MKFKFKNLVAIVLAVLICASVIISCPFAALDSPAEMGESQAPKPRYEMTHDELIAEVAPTMPEHIEESKEVKEFDGLIGDVDGDGKVSILDATAIQRWLAQFNQEINEELSDTDGDGIISITDATVIQRRIADIDQPEEYPIAVNHKHSFEDVELESLTDEEPIDEECCKTVQKCSCGAIQTTTYSSHEYEEDSYEEPKCEESGTVVFKCKKCGKTYTAEIKPLGHNYKTTIVPATCTQSGREICRCQNKDCYYYKSKTIKALGHDIVEHLGKAATCEEDGYEAYKTCTRCDYTTYQKIEATGHVADEPVKENETPDDGSYDEVIYCKNCHVLMSKEHHEGQAQTHTHTPGEPVKENEVQATCTNFGSYEEVIYCKDCGEEISRETITTPKGEHSIISKSENKVPATCVKKGSYDEVAYCKRCKQEISRVQQIISIDPNAHTPDSAVRENEKSATCVQKGSYDEVVYCKDCHTEISRNKKETNINPDAHAPASEVRENEKSATCIQNGSYDEVVYCNDCHTEISRTTKSTAINPNAHKTINYVKEVPVTTTKEGTKAHYKCPDCGKLFSDENGKNETSKDSLIIPKLVHEHKPAKAVREKIVGATCFSTGSYEEVVYCADCGAELSRTRKTIDKVPHAEEPPVKENVKAATCVQKGSYDEVIYCGACNAEISRTKKEIEIDSNAHNLTHVNEVPATTTKEGTNAHYKCSLCGKLFSDKDGKNEVTAASLVIPKITSTDPSTCSHHWVKYVIPYDYSDLYNKHRDEIPFTDDDTRNTLQQTWMGALTNHTGWAIYYCDKCHIADYDRFYTNQEFGRTQKEEEELSLQYVNDLRTSLGLKKMRLNSYTTAMAQERAKELLTNFSHDGIRTGTTENIATTSGGAKSAFELWKKSSGHYAMMTAKGWWYFGYAYAVVPPQSNGTHWRLDMIQVFERMD